RTTKLGFTTPTRRWTQAICATQQMRELLGSSSSWAIKAESLRRFAEAGPDKGDDQLLWRICNYLKWRQMHFPSVRAD
ncbi:MAG TPA: hypothetical protein VM491_16175, partial [Burkholderiaceae bacterium]|nr:hypothetical protein [Burkholderiaceae bacterium]